MTRAERRNQAVRAKGKAKVKLARGRWWSGSWWGTPMPDRLIGRNASQHGTCGCHTCTAKGNAPAIMFMKGGRSE